VSDDVKVARLWIDNAVKAQSVHEDDVAVAYAGIAQAHATLALVEQQRIANLIAAAALTIDSSTPNEAHRALFAERHAFAQDALSPEIRKGLGL
jgi:hypothetical protein